MLQSRPKPRPFRGWLDASLGKDVGDRRKAHGTLASFEMSFVGWIRCSSPGTFRRRLVRQSGAQVRL